MGSDFDVFDSKFSQDIYKQKYSLNGTEKWADTCKRVVDNVCGQLLNDKEKQKIYKIMLDRKFIPGGRYLYSSGRPFHQVNNCFLFRAEDSREGWSDTMQKTTLSLMTGGGIGIDYSSLRPEGANIKRTGGQSTGPIALLDMVNEAGRGIMQGGSRRSAIWAGLNWDHGDVEKFLKLKDWPKELRTLKEKDFNFRLPMELTNISVIYDTEFWIAMENEDHPKHQKAKKVWLDNCRQAFSTAEPGMSFNFRKDNESLRNACLPGFADVQINDSFSKKMKDIEIGDSVVVKYDPNSPLFVNKVPGKYYENGVEINPPHDAYTTLSTKIVTAKVKNKFNNGTKRVYAFTGGSHYPLMCTADHKLLVKDRDGFVKISAATCYNEQIPVLTYHGKSVKFDNMIDLGMHEVFDIEVDHPDHSYTSNEIRVSNCCEVTSEDDSDKCNLGTIWINRFANKKDFAEAVKYATLFLLCGGIYSDVPSQKIKEVGLKNNRIGLGLGGIHEWLMTRGEDYSCVPELHKWLSIYEQESNSMAFIGAKQLNVSVPKGVRAVAPTGSIGIIAETSTGIEPLFCKAYKRRYLKGSEWVYQYVVDGSVKRLLDKGVKLDNIKDSFDLTFKQRVKFQADVQNYVDMAISSTCNMPAWGSESNNETTVEKYANTLLHYSKRLRGFTVYPDGCRAGQPLERVDLKEALDNEGKIYEDKEQDCLNGICGI